MENKGIGVRGPRIVEHMSQPTCQYEKEWPICADDDWVSTELSGGKAVPVRRVLMDLRWTTTVGAVQPARGWALGLREDR